MAKKKRADTDRWIGIPVFSHFVELEDQLQRGRLSSERKWVPTPEVLAVQFNFMEPDVLNEVKVAHAEAAKLSRRFLDLLASHPANVQRVALAMLVMHPMNTFSRYKHLVQTVEHCVASVNLSRKTVDRELVSQVKEYIDDGLSYGQIAKKLKSHPTKEWRMTARAKPWSYGNVKRFCQRNRLARNK